MLRVNSSLNSEHLSFSSGSIEVSEMTLSVSEAVIDDYSSERRYFSDSLLDSFVRRETSFVLRKEGMEKFIKYNFRRKCFGRN